MATNAERDERIAELEDKVEGLEKDNILLMERVTNLRRIVYGLSVIILAMVAFLASRGFDVGGLVNAIP